MSALSSGNLSQFPKISVLEDASLVNGTLRQTSGLGSETDRGPRGSRGSDASVDLTDILERLTSLETRLNEANIEANCSDGEVTVVLNL